MSGYSISGLSSSEAEIYLSDSIVVPENLVLLNSLDNNQTLPIPLVAVDFQYNFSKSIDEAGKIYLSKKPLDTLSGLLKNQKNEIFLQYSYSKEKLEAFLDTTTSDLITDPVFPKANLVNSQITIEKGKPGSKVNHDQIKNEIIEQFNSARFSPIQITFAEIDPSITEYEAQTFEEEAKKLIGKKIKLSAQNLEFELNDFELIEMLAPNDLPNEEAIVKVVKEIAKSVNREPQNSVLVFEESRVKEFLPSKDGLTLIETQLIQEITKGLISLKNQQEKELALALPLETTGPKITTDQVNNLGIKELIGRGTSKFKGSIPSRVHNVSLATSKINGVLIKPGETLSFNEALGDVSKLTGYKEAYVIRDGKTVLGDGGGVCQVSTTLFRAALNAGLPILERRGHSYRVGYYEQDSGPGLDATVYSPTTDLKIINDTPGHILIQASADTKNLTLSYELYGTSDGRVATVTKPVITSQTAPPEDLYVDDPTLPSGQVKQIEHKAWGAKTNFSYEVKRGDEIIYQKTFLTNYRPWQAVYLRGTGPS